MANTWAADKLLDGNGARARPMHHQPVPSQYRGGGSLVKGKRGYVFRHMWIMLGTYVNIELNNLLTKFTLLEIG